MPKKDVEKVINGLDDKIIDIVGNFVKRRKSQYEEAAKTLKNKMRDDVVRYADLLDAKKISAEDFDHLVKGRASQLKIEVLAEVSVSKSKFDLVTNELVGVLIKSTIAVIEAA